MGNAYCVVGFNWQFSGSMAIALQGYTAATVIWRLSLKVSTPDCTDQFYIYLVPYQRYLLLPNCRPVESHQTSSRADIYCKLTVRGPIPRHRKYLDRIFNCLSSLVPTRKNCQV